VTKNYLAQWLSFDGSPGERYHLRVATYAEDYLDGGVIGAL
jgi:hypothetical protein